MKNIPLQIHIYELIHKHEITTDKNKNKTNRYL